MSRTPKATAELREAALAWLVAGVAYAVYAAVMVPRLVHSVHADPDIAGWAGALASRLAGGGGLYEEFIVGMPPLPLALMRLWQVLSGRVRLLDELVMIAALRPALALTVGWLGAPWLGLRGATLASLTALALSLLVAPQALHLWLAAECVLLALLAFDKAQRERRRAWAGVAGACALLAVGCDQASGLGAVLALAAGLTLGRRWRALGGAVLQGALAGAATSLLCTLALGGGVLGWSRVLFVDGFEYAGTPGSVARLLWLRWAKTDAVPLSLVATAVVLWWALVRRPREAARRPPRWGPWLAAAALMLSFLGAGAYVLGWLPQVAGSWLGLARRSELLAYFGVALVALRAGGAVAGFRAGEAVHPGATLAVMGVVAGAAQALGYSVSSGAFGLSALSAVGVVALVEAGQQRAWPWLAVVPVLLAAHALWEPELNRARATLEPAPPGYWQGMLLDLRGQELIAARQQVWALTEPTDEVLVLAEDPQLVALFDRPRPPLRGGLVFVDQYPVRALQGDWAWLQAHPPKLVVVHPARDEELEQAWGDRARTSAAWRLRARVLGRLSGAGYQRQPRVFRTTYGRDTSLLELWVLP